MITEHDCPSREDARGARPIPTLSARWERYAQHARPESGVAAAGQPAAVGA
jgi:hypothetical protein